MPVCTASFLCVQCVLVIYQYKLITSRFDVMLAQEKWVGREEVFSSPPPYSSLSPTPTPSNFFLSLPKLLPNLNQRYCTHLIKMFLLAKIHQSCIYMKSYFYAPFKFLLDSPVISQCTLCRLLVFYQWRPSFIHKLLSHFQSTSFKSF